MQHIMKNLLINMQRAPTQYSAMKVITSVNTKLTPSRRGQDLESECLAASVQYPLSFVSKIQPWPVI